MAYTQAQLDGLKTMLASGTLRARINGEEVIYRSVDEIYKVISMMEKDLGKVRTPVYTPGYVKGMDQ